MGIVKNGFKAVFLIGAVVTAPLAAGACPEIPPDESRLREALAAGTEIAVVTVATVTPPTRDSATTFAILEISQGWGKPKRWRLTYISEQSACGPSTRMKKGQKRVVALNEHEVIDVFEYSSAKKALKSLGDPHYMYDAKGVLKQNPPAGGPVAPAD